MKLDYKQAREIRLKYPENLIRNDIDSIINEWATAGIERVDMLSFSAMYNTRTDKMALGDFELYLRATVKFDLLKLSEFFTGVKFDNDEQRNATMRLWGSCANTDAENLVGYNYPYEVEEETKDLRKHILTEFLDACKQINSKGLLAGISQVRRIRKEVNKKYPGERHPYQKELDKIFEMYIINY